jgi:hypothetical protein
MKGKYQGQGQAKLWDMRRGKEIKCMQMIPYFILLIPSLWGCLLLSTGPRFCIAQSLLGDHIDTRHPDL